jgi:hypothetical protein
MIWNVIAGAVLIIPFIIMSASKSTIGKDTALQITATVAAIIGIVLISFGG